MKDKLSDVNLVRVFEHQTSLLTEEQVRCIRKLNAKLVDLMTSHNEEDYFESSADVFRSCAELIKRANILDQYRNDENGAHIISEYSNQSIESSIDQLQEFLEKSDLIRFDN
jgi:hypothetical protein